MLSQEAGIVNGFAENQVFILGRPEILRFAPSKTAVNRLFLFSVASRQAHALIPKKLLRAEAGFFTT